ncbi:universal stress protein [Umezawaea sp. Da 62-37]|uniref:universal stress protein n=1 Tax=Umezawaea sp. Da 62-37 TaxID=3075927 RepID=UPI0028F6F584|nr:universal stress protein [Umezawaea sp. Da 62-37]WNV84837.1 universal stress protein [Umezawaea sp. Da 62-37]
MENSGKRGLIVVGIDGSPASSAALRWALDQAVLTGAEVEAITARAREAAFVPATSMGVFPYAEKHHDHPVRELHEMVREACSRLDDAPEVIEVVEVGDAATELVRASHHAKLLVLGARGLNRAAEALLGSVVGDCLRRSACPVVVVPHTSTK